MESASYFRFILSLLAVIGMIFAVLWAMRRWGPRGIAMPRGSGRRLAMVDSLVLGAKHRLVLVRRDDHEHLLLLGPAGDLLVEADCKPPKFTLPATGPESPS